MNLSTLDEKLLLLAAQTSLLTISEAAWMLEANAQHIGRRLKRLEAGAYLRHFGNHLVGFQRIPKVYVPSNRCVEHLSTLGISVTSLVPKHVPSWNSKTAHALECVGALLSILKGIQAQTGLQLLYSGLEFRKCKRGQKWVSETADHLPNSAEWIIPDVVILVRRQHTGGQRLMCIEVDRHSEPLWSHSDHSIRSKVERYHRYLTIKGADGMTAFQSRFGANLSYFHLLWICPSLERLSALRRATKEAMLPVQLYGVSSEIRDDFWGEHWKSASTEDLVEPLNAKKEVQ